MSIEDANSDCTTTTKEPEADNGTHAAILTTLYPNYAGPYPVELDGEPLDIQRVEDIPPGARALPSNADGVFFLVGVIENAERDDYTQCANEPTMALFHPEQKRMPLVYVLDKQTQLVGHLESLLDIFEDPNYGIPLPGQDGWEQVHDGGPIYKAQELVELYGSDPDSDVDGDEETRVDVEPQPAAENDPNKFLDAEILTDFNPEADTYQQPIKIMIGKSAKSMDWRPAEMTLENLLAILCEHKVGQKDGMSIVFADMVPGQRLKNAVKAVYAIGLDVDNGIPTKDIDAALVQFGHAGVRYTTHSNNKIKSEFKRDEILKCDPDATEVDNDLIRRYLLEKKNIYAPLVETVEFVEEVHESTGRMILVSHAPWPKNRIVVFLAKPYVIAEEGRTDVEGATKWAKYPRALSELLKIPYDPACTDPSRLFYPPRHPKNAKFSISVFGGPLLEKASLQLGNSFDDLAEHVKKTGGKSITEEGKALGKWSSKYAPGFQITNVIHDYCDHILRGPASSGFHIECPFDGGHSNPGDSNDRACFAVNAAEGANDLFIISCRHGSCANYTMLDMLGKLIADGSIPREALEDPQYDILKHDDNEETKKETEEEEEPTEEAKDKAREEARAAYPAKIAALTPKPSDEALEEVAALVIAAELSVNMFAQAIDDIAKKTKLNKSDVKATFKKISEAAVKSTGTNKNRAVKKNARTIFYHSGYHFDEAVDVCVEALDAKNKRDKLPTFSCMGRNPVFLTINANGKAEFKEMTVQSAWSSCTDLVSFVRISKEGNEGFREKVPEDIAAHIYQQSSKLLRQSPSVIYTPVFLKDGSLLQTPKYHYDEKDPGYLNHLLIFRDGLDVPKLPDGDITKQEALDALAWLKLELLSDFPFCDFDENGNASRDASEAHALAMLITPFMRAMIPGRTPVFFINKPRGGTGGSLLGSLSMLLYDGEVGGAARYTDNDEELNKVIVTAIMSGDSHFFFDDIKEFTSKEIHRNTTAKILSGRILGTNTRVDRENTVQWIAGGNNVKIDDQMDRRLVHIRMNARKANLQERTFRHGGDTPGSVSKLTLEEFVTQKRGEAISHILTLIQFWIEQGEVPFTLRKRVGFEKWCEKVGGVLQCLDVQGFLDNKSGVTASQEYAADLELIAWWEEQAWSGTPTRAADIWDAAFIKRLQIISGRNEEQKRDRFFSDLRRLEGQTFPVEDKISKKTSEYMVTAGKDGTYHLAEIAPEVKPESSGE